MSTCDWICHKTRVKDNDESNRPSPRSGHTLTVMGSNAFLFGGLAYCGLVDSDDSSNGAIASNSLHQLRLSTVTSKVGMEWQKMKLREPSPIARWRHSATLFEDSQILIFGGFHSSDHRYSRFMGSFRTNQRIFRCMIIIHETPCNRLVSDNFTLIFCYKRESQFHYYYFTIISIINCNILHPIILMRTNS